METSISEKLCKGCPEKGLQPIDNFSTRPAKNNTIRSRCKMCERDAARRHRAKIRGINKITKDEICHREEGRKKMLLLYPDSI